MDGHAAKDSLEETLNNGAVHDSFTGEKNDRKQSQGATSTDLSVDRKDGTACGLGKDSSRTKPYDDEEDNTDDTKASKHVECWMDDFLPVALNHES